MRFCCLSRTPHLASCIVFDNRSNPSWFQRPSNIRGMIAALIVACTLLVLAELFYENPHPHFDIETTFAFQAWLGFIAFIVIVFLGWLLRQIVGRPEDYYDR